MIPVRTIEEIEKYIEEQEQNGAPCGSKLEHFCVSGRHRHHTAAPPEVGYMI